MYGRVALVLIGLVIVGLGGSLLIKGWRAQTAVPTYSVRLTEITRVVAELKSARSYPAFAVLMFNLREKPADGDAINLQFSMENGRAGFDWVLLGRQNQLDEMRYVAFARASGYQPVLVEQNGVKYWRVESGDIDRLCRIVITRFYGRAESEPMDMIVEGFEWKP